MLIKNYNKFEIILIQSFLKITLQMTVILSIINCNLSQKFMQEPFVIFLYPKNDA